MSRGCVKLNNECCDQLIERAAKKVRVFDGEAFIPDDHIQLVARYCQGANLKFCFTLPEMETDKGKGRKKRRKSKRRSGNRKFCSCCRCGSNVQENPCKQYESRKKGYAHHGRNNCECKTGRKYEPLYESCSSCETINHRAVGNGSRKEFRRHDIKVGDGFEHNQQAKHEQHTAPHEAGSCFGGVAEKTSEDVMKAEDVRGMVRAQNVLKNIGIGSDNPKRDVLRKSQSMKNVAQPTKSTSDFENVQEVYISKEVSSLGRDEVYRKYWYHQPPAGMVTNCDDAEDHLEKPVIEEIKNVDIPKAGTCIGCKEDMCIVCRHHIYNCICKKPNFVICTVCSRRMGQRRNRPKKSPSNENTALLMSLLANMVEQKQRMACCS